MKEKRISIITPVYNGEKYIEKCILSIYNQQYSNYEHIIIDGGSDDKTLNIIAKYKNDKIKVVSEKDNGMYDAIRKGFEIASGEIFAWLNSDDTYLPWAFQIMNYVIGQGISWCTCMNGIQNNDGIFCFSDSYFYRRKWIEKGYYNGKILRLIQQESTFWTKELFQRANAGELISKYDMAGDFALWREFAKHESLYSVSTAIAGFRVHTGQKSSDMEKYYGEIKDVNISVYRKMLIHLLDCKLYNSNGFWGKRIFRKSKNYVAINLRTELGV